MRRPRVAPATPARPLSTRRIMAVFVAAISGWVGFAVYAQAARGHDLQAAAHQLSAQNAAIRQHISEVSSQIAMAQDPSWLEEQARKIGYVLPGERVYVLASPGAGMPATGGVNAQPPVYSPTPASSPTPSASPTAPGATPTPYLVVLPTPHG